MGIGTVIEGMTVVSMRNSRITLQRDNHETIIHIPQMIRVPEGEFMMGFRDNVTTQPVRKVTISKDFGLGRYPVTNREYLGYLTVTDQPISRLVNNPKLAWHPVVNVSYEEARDYCSFISKITGRDFKLPSEAQWEYAAGAKYPWGNESFRGRVNFDDKGTTRVFSHPKGQTKFGIYAMAGHVWEWMQDFGRYEGYDAGRTVDPIGFGSFNVLRGGSYASTDGNHLKSTSRALSTPKRLSTFGFRVAEKFG